MIPQEQVEKFQKHYPSLHYKRKGPKDYIRGKLEFCAFYNEARDEFTINPKDRVEPQDYLISDAFNIEIQLLADYPKSRPILKESGGRADDILRARGMRNKADLHFYGNNSVCYCSPLEWEMRFPNGAADLVEFMRQFVIPYFYGLSFFETFGRWPWGEYAHKELGLFESYLDMHGKRKNLYKDFLGMFPNTSAEQIELIKKNDFSRKRYCPCGSRKEFGECHTKALSGLKLLQHDLKDAEKPNRVTRIFTALNIFRRDKGCK